MSLRKTLIMTPLLLMLGGCASHAPMPTVDHVDLPRFMGDWYVIANIPTFLERSAHNAVESYRLDEDGTIATTFTFRAGDFNGPERRFRPTAYVLDKDTHARWGMQFIWPIKADFRIIWLEEDYSRTIIGREKRDYVWIMARSPQIPEDDLAAMIAFLNDLGYDTSQIERVPQDWSDGAGGNGKYTEEMRRTY